MTHHILEYSVVYSALNTTSIQQGHYILSNHTSHNLIGSITDIVS